VHDGWSKQESAATEIGLMSRIGKWDIVFHTVRLLLNDVLSQVPHTQFAGVDGQLDRERGMTLATHRLLEYTRDSAAVDIQDVPFPSLNSLSVKWRGLNMPLPSSDDADRNGAVRIQLHMTSTCKRFASLNSNMTCCVSDVKTSSSDAWHSFDGLELGVEYFAIIYKPSDPYSIPVVTRPCRCEAISPSQSVRRSISTPSPQSTPISLPSEVNGDGPLIFVPGQGRYERVQMESLTSSIDILASRDWYGDASATRGGRVMMAPSRPGRMRSDSMSTPSPSSSRDEPVYISDSLSFDSDDYTEEAELKLEHIKNSETVKLPIRSTYTHWQSAEAFRELVQNWRDAIIESFGLAESQFTPVREEHSQGLETEIIYKVWKPNSEPKEWLGFIRFKARDGKGTVELVNRQGKLEPHHMDMGSTSKASNLHQAGAHGEGLKIALLVLQRGWENHAVSCETGSFRWDFNFTTQGRLMVRLVRMTPAQLLKAREKATKLHKESLVPFITCPTKDVRFIIGENVVGRDEYGNKVRRNEVRLEEFQYWCRAAIFLESLDQTEKVNTRRGTLILDSRFCGNLYLKGLLLSRSTTFSSASITGRPLRYGYDFANGTTNRDRQSISSSKEECRAILSIWGFVLKRQPTYVRELSDMLNSTLPLWADVAMAKDVIKRDTVTCLKEHLFSDTSKWYHSNKEKVKNPRLDKIIEGLGRTPFELQNTYWDILNTFNMVRSAEDEQRCRFLAADPLIVPEEDFAQQIDRLLRGILCTCPQTKDTELKFVKAGNLLLQTFYLEEERLIKVHERWLNLDETTKELGIPHSVSEIDVLFCAVTWLYNDILDQILIEKFSSNDGQPSSWHRETQKNLAFQRLLEHSRVASSVDLETTLNSTSSDLAISWGHVGNSASSSSQQGLTRFEIRLHNDSICSHIRKCPLVEDGRYRLSLRIRAIAAVLSTSKSHNPSSPNYSLYSEGGCKKRFVDASVQPHPALRHEAKSNNLKRGIKYFAIIMNRDEPLSLPVVLNPSTISNARQRDPTPSPPATGRQSVDSRSERTYETEALGNSINSLDVLVRRDWFEAANTPSGAVVVGIRKDDKGAEDSRKRQRT
ncbi:hypothetical protein FDECE_16375, partial [Fusarium decemcellulare]